MSSFRGGLAFDLVDLGCFHAHPGWLRPIFGPIRHLFDTSLPCRGQIKPTIAHADGGVDGLLARLLGRGWIAGYLGGRRGTTEHAKRPDTHPAEMK